MILTTMAKGPIDNNISIIKDSLFILKTPFIADPQIMVSLYHLVYEYTDLLICDLKNAP
jgi:hypothetical protein